MKTQSPLFRTVSAAKPRGIVRGRRAAPARRPWSAILVLLAACSAPERYPAAPRGAEVDEFFGTRVADPYRWLEDPDSPATRAWIAAENELTESHLARIPGRERIRERLEALWRHARFDAPLVRGERVFFRRALALQDQPALVVLDRPGAEPRVLIDPTELSPDGTVALASYVPSPDGELVAYALSDGGSDWRAWRVRRVADGVDLSDEITRNKFGGLAWAADGSGFWYSRYDAPAEGERLRERNPPPDVAWHALGTDEGADVVVLERPEREGVSQGFAASDDRVGLVVTRWEASARKAELDWFALDGPTAGRVVPLARGFDAQYHYAGGDGNVLYVWTDRDAPRWRVVAIDPRSPDPAGWREVVPESADAIQDVEATGGSLFVTYLADAAERVERFALDGRPLGPVALPGIGNVAGFAGEIDQPLTFFSFTSFTAPTTIYRHEIAAGRSEVFRRPELAIDQDAFETRQVFVVSKDGTRIPMFLVHRAGLEPGEPHPTYLYGYGGFGISITPWFSVEHLAWVEMGGVLAVANLRGGGEYGEEWHAAGTKLRKQNVFDDFVAAAEWLIEAGWTSRERLAIGGRSNGGLLVGACLTQRPDLFAAAVPAVGVLDMLRYHRFTIGWAWAGDYGTSDDLEEFRALFAYSPLHNVRPGTEYPATLITTADHDDRVVPAHSFKFAAALQHAQAGTEPILIRVETRAGHGAGKPTRLLIDEGADVLAFLAHELELE
jgi:prolyl oligopeptidase